MPAAGHRCRSPPLALRHGPSVAPDADLHVPQRGAERNLPGVRREQPGVEGRADGALGEPVDVGEPGRLPGLPVPVGPRVHALAADHHQAQPGRGGQAPRVEPAGVLQPVLRGQFHHRGPGTGDHGVQLLRVQGPGVGPAHDRRAGHEGGEYLLDQDVEAQRRHLEPAVPGGQLQPFGDRRGEPAQRVPLDERALGLPGGPRREQHVRHVVSGGPGRRPHRVAAGVRRPGTLSGRRPTGRAVRYVRRRGAWAPSPSHTAASVRRTSESRAAAGSRSSRTVNPAPAFSAASMPSTVRPGSANASPTSRPGPAPRPAREAAQASVSRSTDRWVRTRSGVTSAGASG